MSQNEPTRLNVNQVNKFTAGLLDIQISRHPLSSEITIIFNTVTEDIYHDIVKHEESRVNKLAIVRTDKDAEYIQQLFPDDILMDNDERVPYVVTMTLTGLKRKPKMGDCVMYKDIEFTVSKVKPLNEHIDSTLTFLMYPTRDDIAVVPYNTLILDVFLYDLDLKPVNVLSGHVGEELIMDVVYDGDPRRYSFDGETWKDLVLNRIKFKVDSAEMTLYVQDSDDTVSDFNIK